jgi:hypothetical protein
MSSPMASMPSPITQRPLSQLNSPLSPHPFPPVNGTSPLPPQISDQQLPMPPVSMPNNGGQPPLEQTPPPATPDAPGLKFAGCGKLPEDTFQHSGMRVESAKLQTGSAVKSSSFLNRLRNALQQ